MPFPSGSQTCSPPASNIVVHLAGQDERNGPSSKATIRVVHDDEDQRLVVCGNMLVSIYRGRVTTEMVERGAAVLRELDERFDGDFGFLILPHSSSEVPSGEIRRLVIRYFRQFEHMKAGQSILILGNDVSAFALRMTGRVLKLWGQLRVELCSAMEEAVRFHASRSERVDEDALRDVLAPEVEVAEGLSKRSSLLPIR